MSYETNYTFSNLHENISFNSARCYDLDNTDAGGNLPTTFISCFVNGAAHIRGVLADAINDGKTVRAVGNKWSLSDAQQTPGYLINTSALDQVRVGLQPDVAGYSLVQPGIDPAPWCLCQCGASVFTVNDELRKQGLSLSTTGASDGQTIVGAFSTGTHGSAFNFGAMPDYVEALHIIVSNTLHYWIEGNTPIVSNIFINNYVPGATRINNDDILNSAIVSFGSFGVIHGALLKVEPIYILNHTQLHVNWSDVKDCLNWPFNLAPLSQLPTDNLYNYTVVGSPYLQDMIVAHVMQKLPYDPTNPPVDPANDPTWAPSGDALAFIGELSDLAPFMVPSLMDLTKGQITKRFPVISPGKPNIPAWTFANGTAVSPGKALSVELGIDATKTSAAADVIFALCNSGGHSFPGLISFRYVKQTKATLGFTKYPVTCTVEFPAVYSDDTKNFYTALYSALDDAGIEYTFHWGQCNNLDDKNIVKKYGQAAINTWLKARYAILQTQQQQQMFNNDFMARLGLDVLSPPSPPPPPLAG